MSELVAAATRVANALGVDPFKPIIEGLNEQGLDGKEIVDVLKNCDYSVSDIAELAAAFQALNDTPHEYTPIVKKLVEINKTCKIVERVRDDALEKFCTADNITNYVGVSAPELIEPIKNAIKEIPVASYVDLAQAVDHFSADNKYEPLITSVYNTLGEKGKAFISQLRDKVVDEYAAQISTSKPELKSDLEKAAPILKAISIEKLIPVAVVFLEESSKMNKGSMVGGSTSSALQKSFAKLEELVDDKALFNKLKTAMPTDLKPIEIKGISSAPLSKAPLSSTSASPESQVATKPSASPESQVPTKPSASSDQSTLIQTQESKYDSIASKIPIVPSAVLKFLKDGDSKYLSSMVYIILSKADGNLDKAKSFASQMQQIFDDYDQKELLSNLVDRNMRTMFFNRFPEWKQQIFENLTDELQTKALDANPYLVYKVFYNSSKKFTQYSPNMMLKPDLLNAMDIDGFVAYLQTCKPGDIKANAFEIGLTPKIWAKLDPDIMKAVPRSVLEGLDAAYITTMTSAYYNVFTGNNMWILLCFSLIVTVSNLVAYGMTTWLFSLQAPDNMKSSASKAYASFNWGTEDEEVDLNRQMVEEDVDYTEEEETEPPVNPSVNKNSIFVHYVIQFVIGGILVGLLCWSLSSNGWSDILGGIPMRPRRIELWHIAGLFVVYQIALLIITLLGCFRELFETNENVFGPLIFGFPTSMIFNLDDDNIDKEVLYHYVLFCGYFMMSLVVMYIALPLIVVAKYSLLGKELVNDNQD